MKDSIVGDPIFWPGLVYSPINHSGLLFALGTVTGEIGLLFEEFSEDEAVAICRRKTDRGWKKIRVALSVRSSEFDSEKITADMLICWKDDSEFSHENLHVLELSAIKGKMEPNPAQRAKSKRGLDSIFPEDPSEDLLKRGQTIHNFEETIRQLDERIKKLKND
jgi:hypothetical protein